MAAFRSQQDVRVEVARNAPAPLRCHTGTTRLMQYGMHPGTQVPDEKAVYKCVSSREGDVSHPDGLNDDNLQTYSFGGSRE